MTGWSARDLINAMGTLHALPRPFNMPMPYYVGARHTNLHLECTTQTRHDGGVTCVVNLPDPRYALEWLGRVNGTCGLDYELLEHELLLVEVDAWGRLTEACRQRLGVWCALRPRERFRLYLSDADFGAHDAGLGGLVVTDRRLVFRKYHHHGTLDLAADATLLVQVKEGFAHLTLQNQEGRSKLVKLHVGDLEKLQGALAGAPGLQVVVGSE
jgi:hypothetical protein